MSQVPVESPADADYNKGRKMYFEGRQSFDGLG